MSQFLHTNFHDPTAFWTMITRLATVLLIVVAWIQLGSIGKTSQADFIFRLKGEFFTEKARRLIFLIDYEKLKFVRDADQRPSAAAPVSFPLAFEINRQSAPSSWSHFDAI
jgi:hypothetical protein